MPMVVFAMMYLRFNQPSSSSSPPASVHAFSSPFSTRQLLKDFLSTLQLSYTNSEDDIIPVKDEEEDLISLAQGSSNSMERAWRHAKKPLMSIGAKGATLTHGNSLRQLLEQHTVVKVKVNTRMFDNSLQQAFFKLVQLAEENGAPPGIELLQARESEKIILFGWPGTRERIDHNDFPPQEENASK